MVEEDELLSGLMDDEGAVDKTAPDEAVAETGSTEFGGEVAVGSDLNWAGAVEVLFLLLCRWHSAFHVRREIGRQDHRVMTVMCE